MKRILLSLCFVAVIAAQAQTYYVAGGGKKLGIDVNETKEITFDADNLLISIDENSGVTHTFATEALDGISFEAAQGEEVFYNEEIPFSKSTEYSEIVETIVTDELHDEYGDFVEYYEVSKTITITFSEGGVTCTPATVAGVTFKKENGHLTVTSTIGKVGYIVKGTSSNGSLKIYSDKKFQIMLSNLNLTNPTGPAINIQTGKTVYFTLGSGSVNTLCDGAVYSDPVVGADGETEDQKGTLFSEGQLVFNGTGTLNVTSHGGHGICSDDYIRVRSGKINIEAVKDGFHTNDLFRVGRMKASAPVITVNAGGDAIDCGKGKVLIEAGDFTLNSVGEAVKVSYEEEVIDPQVNPSAILKGGILKIVTTGEKASAVKTTGAFTLDGATIIAEVRGNGSKIINSDSIAVINKGYIEGYVLGALSSDTVSAGGVKCAKDLTVNGGLVQIACSGAGAKALNCDATIKIAGGDVRVLSTAPNYEITGYDRTSRAIDCNNYLQTGGVVQAKSYDNAVSALSLNLSSGIINLYSTDDYAIDADVTQTGGWLLTKDKE